MTDILSKETRGEAQDPQAAAMNAALKAAYGALGKGEADARAVTQATAAPRRCSHCGVEGQMGRGPSCFCDLAQELISGFLTGIRDSQGYRREYSGCREEGGVSLYWDNASAQYDVDDFEVVPGSFELDLRFPRFLTGYEIEALDRLLVDNLYPAFVEVERPGVHDEDGTCFHVAVDFMDGR